MGGYMEEVDGEIVHPTCISCEESRWYREIRDGKPCTVGYCHNTGCEVNKDTDACDRFTHLYEDY